MCEEKYILHYDTRFFMKSHRADETTVHPAASNTSSLKITIPRFLVNTMHLKRGDIIRWQQTDSDKIVLTIQKTMPTNKTEPNLIDTL